MGKELHGLARASSLCMPKCLEAWLDLILCPTTGDQVPKHKTTLDFRTQTCKAEKERRGACANNNNLVRDGTGNGVRRSYLESTIRALYFVFKRVN